MKNPKVGERCKVNWSDGKSERGEIVGVHSAAKILIRVKLDDDGEVNVDRRICVRIKKKPREEVWVNYFGDGGRWAYFTQEAANKAPKRDLLACVRFVRAKVQS